jgi:hypothetical protein
MCPAESFHVLIRNWYSLQHLANLASHKIIKIKLHIAKSHLYYPFSSFMATIRRQHPQPWRVHNDSHIAWSVWEWCLALHWSTSPLWGLRSCCRDTICTCMCTQAAHQEAGLCMPSSWEPLLLSGAERLINSKSFNLQDDAKATGSLKGSHSLAFPPARTFAPAPLSQSYKMTLGWMLWR